MDKFIEVTERDGLKILINCSHITSIYRAFKTENQFKTFLWTNKDECYKVKENYEEIKEKITGC